MISFIFPKSSSVKMALTQRLRPCQWRRRERAAHAALPPPPSSKRTSPHCATRRRISPVGPRTRRSHGGWLAAATQDPRATSLEGFPPAAKRQEPSCSSMNGPSGRMRHQELACCLQHRVFAPLPSIMCRPSSSLPAAGEQEPRCSSTDVAWQGEAPGAGGGAPEQRARPPPAPPTRPAAASPETRPHDAAGRPPPLPPPHAQPARPQMAGFRFCSSMPFSNSCRRCRGPDGSISRFAAAHPSRLVPLYALPAGPYMGGCVYLHVKCGAPRHMAACEPRHQAHTRRGAALQHAIQIHGNHRAAKPSTSARASCTASAAAVASHRGSASPAGTVTPGTARPRRQAGGVPWAAAPAPTPPGTPLAAPPPGAPRSACAAALIAVSATIFQVERVETLLTCSYWGYVGCVLVPGKARLPRASSPGPAGRQRRCPAAQRLAPRNKRTSSAGSACAEVPRTAPCCRRHGLHYVVVAGRNVACARQQ